MIAKRCKSNIKSIRRLTYCKTFGGTGASSVSSVRTAIGLLSGAFTTTSQATVHTTSDLGVNTNSIVVAGLPKGQM